MTMTASNTPLLSFLEVSERGGSSRDMRGQNVILGCIKMPGLAQLGSGLGQDKYRS
jgi:hypothetical protein